MSGIPRKIYVEEGELVEIRVVSKGEQKNAAGFQGRLYPVRHKYLIYIGSDSIEMPVVQPFGFKMCGKTWGPIAPVSGGTPSAPVACWTCSICGRTGFDKPTTHGCLNKPKDWKKSNI